MPNKEYYLVESYAAENELNRSQAVISLLRRGLAAEAERPASSAELAALRAELQISFQTVAKAIESQPIAVQQNAPTLPEPGRKLSLRERLLGRTE